MQDSMFMRCMMLLTCCDAGCDVFMMRYWMVLMLCDAGCDVLYDDIVDGTNDLRWRMWCSWWWDLGNSLWWCLWYLKQIEMNLRYDDRCNVFQIYDEKYKLNGLFKWW